MSTIKNKSGEKNLWDYEAYAAIPFDGRRHEIIEGAHFVNPAPNLYHQDVSRRIQFQLMMAMELNDLGKVYNAPVDLQLSDHDIVQSDLVVVTRPREHILTPTRINGIPDLVVEILSPSNHDYDLKTKRRLYERFGVPEYWIVFPDEHRILQLVLGEQGYTETTESNSITMRTAPHPTVDLSRVW